MKHMQKMAEELVDCFLKRRTDPLQMSQTAGTGIDDLQDQSMAHPALAPAEPLARATASLDRELSVWLLIQGRLRPHQIKDNQLVVALSKASSTFSKPRR